MSVDSTLSRTLSASEPVFIKYLITHTSPLLLSCQDVSILVNDAGVGYYGAFVNVPTKKLQMMVQLNNNTPARGCMRSAEVAPSRV